MNSVIWISVQILYTEFWIWILSDTWNGCSCRRYYCILLSFADISYWLDICHFHSSTDRITECWGPPCHISVKVSDITISCSSLCEAVRLRAEMVIEDSYILVLSCVEKGKIKRWKLVTTSGYLADNCSYIPLSSLFILAYRVEEGCFHTVASWNSFRSANLCLTSC